MNLTIIKLLLGTAILFSAITSCKKEEGGPVPENVENITAVPGYGAVRFGWSFPSDTAFLYVSISYADSTGKKVENKYSRYTSGTIIQGLVHQSYDFTVCTVSESGRISEKKIITVKPDDPVYEVAASTLHISSGIGAAVIGWKNTTGETMGITISYLDSTGVKKVVSDSSSAVADSTTVTGLPAVPCTFTVILSDASGAHGAPIQLTTTPLLEIRIPKSGWTITADSQEEIGEGATDGFATAAIDDDLSTYWHTEWYNALPGYPHWLAVDMKQEVTLSRIELTPRQGKTDGFTTFNIDISTDGLNWTTYAAGLNLVQNQETQSFDLSSNPRVRYVRIYATAGVGDYAHLAELTIYGSY